MFTAFLGMELKAAVGTSTFIMTFTALIASVSHILIHPAILLDRWPVLVLCMTVATAASLASARFANRVDSRTVGLVTGVVLTLLGAALILLHYWEYIKDAPLLYGVLGCTLEFLEYIIPAAAILLCLHHFFKIPSHVFRKLLHLAALSAPVIKCKKTPRKKCNYVAEEREKDRLPIGRKKRPEKESGNERKSMDGHTK